MIIQPTQNADSPGGSGSIPGRKIAVHKSCSASSLKLTKPTTGKEGHGSFADAVIAALGTRAGCSCTLTFDQMALRLPGFEFP
jgi:hypothetical protein